MKTLVYIECNKDGAPLSASLEALAPAAALGEAQAVLIGADEAAAGQVSALGFPTLLVPAQDASPDAVTALLTAAAERTGAELVLMSATQSGKDLAPRVAKRLGGGCVTDAVALEPEDGRAVFTRPAYGGGVLERLALSGGAATLRSGSFTRPQAGPGGSVETLELALPEGAVKAKLARTVREIAELVDLESAQVIVAGGLGMGSAENFRLVEELAALLGGVVGASRPAIEEGWVSRAHQIGQSGKTVAPRLYIACGISGATQHISGALGAQCIVAVNTDADAPIFKVADVGIVGDAAVILPALMEELRARKAD